MSHKMLRSFIVKVSSIADTYWVTFLYIVLLDICLKDVDTFRCYITY